MTTKHSTRIIKFCEKYPKIASAIKLSYALGATGAIFSILSDLSKGLEYSQIIYNFIANVASSAGGTICGTVLAEYGALYGTAFFPGYGTMIGGFAGFVVGSYSASWVIEIILKEMLS